MSVISNKVIGMHLREARQRKKFSQATVAEFLHVSENHYGYIERGDRPASLEMLGLLCDYLDVSLEELIAGAVVDTGLGVATESIQRERLEAMIKRCPDDLVETLSDVVESLIKYANK